MSGNPDGLETAGDGFPEVDVIGSGFPPGAFGSRENTGAFPADTGGGVKEGILKRLAGVFGGCAPKGLC